MADNDKDSDNSCNSCTKSVRTSRAGGYRVGSYNSADNRNSLVSIGSEGSGQGGTPPSQSDTTHPENEVLLGHILRITEDDDPAAIDVSLYDDYYSKEDIEMIMPMVRADIAQIRASSESLRALDEVQKWHTADPPKILGQGTYGRVLEAIDDCTGEIIAVKETTRSRAPKNKSIKALQKEMSTLRLLSHQNIVQYRGVQTATRTDGEDDTLLFLMEYCPNGSISDVLEDFGALGDDVTRRYTSQILCGLDYLHRLCIVHRDIKCANCLLSVGGVVKLADFGSSKHLSDCGNSIQGTALYMAPEVIKGRRVGRQADVWAVGCCVVEMLGNSMPFEGRFSNDFALMYRISKTKTSPKPPDDISGEAKSFVEACFTFVPEKRPTAFWLFTNHVYVKGQYPLEQPPSTPMAPRSPDMQSLSSAQGASWGRLDSAIEGGAAKSTDIMMKPRVTSGMASKIEGVQGVDSSSKIVREVSPLQSPVLTHDLSAALMPDHNLDGESIKAKSKRLEDHSNASVSSSQSGKSGKSSSHNTMNTGGSSHASRHLYGTNRQGSDAIKGSVGKSATFDVASANTLAKAPMLGGTAEDNIGRLATTTGFLFERFEVDDVEADYQAFFKSRAVKYFTTSTMGGMPILLFGLYALTAGVFYDISKIDSFKLAAKIMSWTLLAGLQIMPIEFGESAFHFISSIVTFFQIVSLATCWGHDNVYHLFELAVITTLSGYLFSIRRHVAFLLIYSSILAAEGSYEIWTLQNPTGEQKVHDGSLPSMLDAFTSNLGKWLQLGNHTEVLVNAMVMMLSIGVVHRMHQEGRVKYALGFHIKHS